MDSRRCFYFLEIFIFSFFRLQAQIIHTEPVFPLVNQSVIIYYDAAEGNQGLMGYTGDVYAHTGVITNLSTSPSDWKYVKTNWGQNTQETKLERISANYYRLTISPDIRSYYGVPANEQILKMAFVFRSGVTIGGSYKEGKDVGNADIFVDVYPPDLSINITSPQGNHLIEAEGDTILVHAISPQADSMWVFENGSLRKAVAGVFMDDTLVASPINGYWNDHHLIFVAKNSQQIVRDTLFYVVIPQPTVVELPDGIYDGINYVDDSTVILCLQAPGKKNVFAIGDFSNWEILPEYYMNKTADGERFWLEISSLIPAKEYIYQYLVDGKIRISDPYCDKISDPWNDKYIPTSVYPAMLIYPSGKTTGIASVLQTAQEPFAWQIEQFSPPSREKLVIYELLIRDFTTKHTYQSVIDTLNYLVKLGVNAIELMPLMEFEGNSSWGYNPMTYFAPDKYYGPKNDLKKLIDECHKRGIAVILDIVLNHAYGNNPLVKLYWDDVKQIPAADNPWFNQTSPNPSYSWGYDFNHESPYTKQFVYRVTRYWLTEYKADGFRFDFSKGFTNKPGDGWAYDATRIAILKNYTDSIWSVNPQA
ncbi:MAG TPA: alpha-amylase family glycosyl hydrolase, partial [Bacteroidales bacterium]|nr:alpha-amylase family glycosyl hydrolase [Bacteroidales bacterium]